MKKTLHTSLKREPRSQGEARVTNPPVDLDVPQGTNQPRPSTTAMPRAGTLLALLALVLLLANFAAAAEKLDAEEAAAHRALEQFGIGIPGLGFAIRQGVNAIADVLPELLSSVTG